MPYIAFPRSNERRALRDESVPVPPGSFADAFAESAKETALTHNLFAPTYRRILVNESVNEAMDSVREQTGIDLRPRLEMRLRDAKLRGQEATSEDYAATYDAETALIRAKYPLAHVPTLSEIESSVDESLRGLVESGADERRRMPGAAGAVVGFAGSMAGSMADPINLAGMAIAGPGLASGFLRSVAYDAAVNAGIEALEQPAIQEVRKSLGLEHGTTVAAGEIATAFAAGAGFSALGRGAIEALGIGRAVRAERLAMEDAARIAEMNSRAMAEADAIRGVAEVPELREWLSRRGVKVDLLEPAPVIHFDATGAELGVPASTVPALAESARVARPARLVETVDAGAGKGSVRGAFEDSQHVALYKIGRDINSGAREVDPETGIAIDVKVRERLEEIRDALEVDRRENMTKFAAAYAEKVALLARESEGGTFRAPVLLAASRVPTVQVGKPYAARLARGARDLADAVMAGDRAPRRNTKLSLLPSGPEFDRAVAEGRAVLANDIEARARAFGAAGSAKNAMSATIQAPPPALTGGVVPSRAVARDVDGGAAGDLARNAEKAAESSEARAAEIASADPGRKFYFSEADEDGRAATKTMTAKDVLEANANDDKILSATRSCLGIGGG